MERLRNISSQPYNVATFQAVVAPSSPRSLENVAILHGWPTGEAGFSYLLKQINQPKPIHEFVN